MKLNRILSVFLASLLLFFYAGCSSYLLDLQNAMDEEGQETSSEVRSPTPVIIGPVTLANFAQVVGSLTQNSTIVLTGPVTPSDLSIIRTAIRRSDYLINLDLSNVTGLDSIPSNIFHAINCLSGITLPDGVTSIGNHAFDDCSSLTSINIPESVTSIGNYVFYRCTQLAEINVDLNNTNYSSLDGVLFNKNKTQLICYPKGKTGTSYSIPGSVTSIEDNAFIDCDNLSSIIISENVTSIGDSAFYRCTSLTSINIPESVTSIGNYVFSDCYQLAEINVDLENTNYSSLDGVLFNKNKTQLICYPKEKTGTSYSIPGSVTSIGLYAFSDCDNLSSIIISENVTSIGKYAFYKCTSLTSINIPESVTSIGMYVFYMCSNLTSITFSDTSTWYETTTETDWINKTGGTEINVTYARTSTFNGYYLYKL